MEWWLCVICFVLVCICIFLFLKLSVMRKSVNEICEGISGWLEADSNVGIDVSGRDPKIRKLAAMLDRELQKLRQEHIRYVQGDQELKRAITNLSHDLRTPVTAVCGYMELLQKEELPDEAKRYLAIMKQRVLSLKDMMEELFQYSIILSVEIYQEKTKVSLNKVLEECIAQHYGALKVAGVEPVISIPETVVYRKLNEKALFRIFQNIISNMIKYSAGDCKIILEESGTVCFQNHAYGLDNIQVGHLFDRFYTIESGRESTGLGLSIAKALSEEMGGQINAGYEDDLLTITVHFYSAP